ncbi:MAG: hypothetical protein GVY09_00290 [Gammaproteobacteria bacterium]|jgi:hypothetical protein|nr:hypothetical protein [Gammaproteobacteria bacterium]
MKVLRIMTLLPGLVLVAAHVAAGDAHTQNKALNETELWQLLRTGEAAVLMRHARAPGTGHRADQVKVTALTNVFPASGEMVIVRPAGGDAAARAKGNREPSLVVLGRITAP